MMTIGELRANFEKSKSQEEIVEESIARARAAYAHVDGLSDLDALALLVSHLRRLSRERLEDIRRLKGLS